MNLDRIVPEAREIVGAAAEIYVRHTGDDFVGLIAHGSAVKGDFIAGCSDIDFKLFVRQSALDDHGFLHFTTTVDIHRELSQIDPAPFQYIQCYAMGETMRPGWTGPIPGAFTILAGSLPVPEATAEELRASAVARITALEPVPNYLGDNLLEHGGGRLARLVRLLCTDVWPVLVSLLIVRGEDPIVAWNMTKYEAMEALPTGSAEHYAIRNFHEVLLAYYPEAASTEIALGVLVGGAAFLSIASIAAAGYHTLL